MRSKVKVNDSPTTIMDIKLDFLLVDWPLRLPIPDEDDDRGSPITEILSRIIFERIYYMPLVLKTDQVTVLRVY